MVLMFFSHPLLEELAGILCSSKNRRPGPLQADRTYNAGVEFVTSFGIEGRFLQRRGKQICPTNVFVSTGLYGNWSF